MENKETLLDMLIRHEGLKLKPYHDSVGKLTIGIGRNLDDVGITKEEAIYMCNNNIKEVTDQLNAALPWFKDQPDVVKNVLIDMGFMGVGSLLKFTFTLNYIKIKKYKAAAVEMLDSTWARQVGDRAIELSNILKSVNQ